MITLPKGTNVDTTKLQQGELIQMDFTLYNVNSIHIFTYIITVLCEKTIILLVFTDAPKHAPVHTTHFILTTIKN